MANVRGSNFVLWDTLSGAAIQERVAKVKKIFINYASGTGAKVCTLQRENVTFLSVSLNPTESAEFDYSPYQNMRGLAASALDSPLTVLVEFE
jgi:hypothetical protein